MSEDAPPPDTFGLAVIALQRVSALAGMLAATAQLPSGRIEFFVDPARELVMRLRREDQP